MNNQKGLAPIAILIIVVVAIVGISVYRNQNANQNKATKVEESSPSSSPTSTPSAKPVVINKKTGSIPSPIATSKATSSPSPTPNTSNLSCEIKLRGDQSSTGYAPYIVYFFGTDKSPNAGASTQWDFDGDGKWDTSMNQDNINTQYTYQKAGTYNVKLQTRNATYGDTNCSTTITVKTGTIECKVHADKTSGGVAREFDFAYEATRVGTLENVDNNKDLVEAAQWDFDGNGSWDTSFDAASKKLKYTYSSAGNYNVRLQVKAQGNVTSEVCTKTVSVQ